MKRSRPDGLMEGAPPATRQRTTFRAVQTMAPGEPAPYRQLKVEDALAYLDKVKTQFGNQPQIYNQFLEIMKNFKAQTIDTPGVIQRVSELFKGNNNLILGFNTFLPPGYKIEVVTEEIPIPQPMSAQLPAPAPPPVGAAGARGGRRQGGMVVGDPGGAPQQPQQQPLEFDHAINYVTRIKRRFVTDPDTYKQFLDILHTYQKQQRSIKDVLEKVSKLFRNHPDLLRDFTYFLPDAVQGQVEAILRQNKARAMLAGKSKGRGRKGDRDMGRDAHDHHMMGDPYHHDKGSRRPRRRMRNSVRDEPLRASLPPSEKTFFQRIKASLGNRERWMEFLKCLDLFAREVVSRTELLTLLENIFTSRHAHLLDDLKILLNNRGTLDNLPEDVWYSLPVSEIDFSNCRTCTPSYRHLPDSYPSFTCAERTAADADVLNDEWVSVPTGSEDFSFKSMRKNQYEEALFRCEDERYEVDMVLENNASAIRVLEPLAEEINTLRAQDGGTVWQMRIDARTLGVTHLKAISRVYGDHGAEMLELLRRNPGGAIPVILKRLKQKEIEWKKVRSELNKGWKEVLEKNYPKSLDHRSFYFKSSDKKALHHKALVAEIKARTDGDEGAADSDDDKAAAPASSGAAASASASAGAGAGAGAGSGAAASAGAAVGASITAPATDRSGRKYHISVGVSDIGVHEDVANVLNYAVERSCNTSEKERIAGLWREVLEPFFQFQPEWSFSGRATTTEGGAVVFEMGSEVDTDYGRGTVAEVRHPDGYSGGTVYVVQLPFGQAILQPSAVRSVPSADTEMSDAAATGGVRPLAVAPTASGAADESSAASAEQSDAEGGAKKAVEPSVYYGTSSEYVLFRLHGVLLERLARAKELCASAKAHHKSVSHPMDRLNQDKSEADKDNDTPGNQYKYFLTALYAFIDNPSDSSKYEDECRNLMGAGSYMLFTLDKVISQTVKQLASTSNDSSSQKMRALFAYHNHTLAPGAAHGLSAEETKQTYDNNCKAVMAGQNEECYFIEYTVTPHEDAPSSMVLGMRYMGRPRVAPADTALQTGEDAQGAGWVDPSGATNGASDASGGAAAGGPFLNRTQKAGAAGAGAATATSAAGAGAGGAATAGASATTGAAESSGPASNAVAAPAVAVNGLAAQVAPSGEMVYQPGGTDVFVRKTAGGAGGATATGAAGGGGASAASQPGAASQVNAWASQRVAGMGAPPTDSVVAPDGTVGAGSAASSADGDVSMQDANAAGTAGGTPGGAAAAAVPVPVGGANGVGATAPATAVGALGGAAPAVVAASGDVAMTDASGGVPTAHQGGGASTGTSMGTNGGTSGAAKAVAAAVGGGAVGVGQPST